MNLYKAPVPPESDDPQWIAFYKYWNTYELARAKYLESVLLSDEQSPFRVPDTTIDLGSKAYIFASAVNALNNFNRAELPNTTTTTSSTFQAALNYTGRGILQCVLLASQVAGGASTAAGASVQITIDGNVVFTGAVLTFANQAGTAVGRLALIDPTNEYTLVMDDPNGLTFNKSCKVEFSSGTNGQGVSIGWKVLKLH